MNEQNPQARGFYEHMGFQVYKRTELDEQGNPYPLIYGIPVLLFLWLHKLRIKQRALFVSVRMSQATEEIQRGIFFHLGKKKTGMFAEKLKPEMGWMRYQRDRQ